MNTTYFKAPVQKFNSQHNSYYQLARKKEEIFLSYFHQKKI
jgi:hypothetical protein